MEVSEGSVATGTIRGVNAALRRGDVNFARETETNDARMHAHMQHPRTYARM